MLLNNHLLCASPAGTSVTSPNLTTGVCPANTVANVVGLCANTSVTGGQTPVANACTSGWSLNFVGAQRCPKP